MHIDLSLIAPPLKTILGRYLRTAKLILVAVLVITLLGSLATIAAPYLFSRLIDSIDATSLASGIIWAFMAYALLMGLGFALQRMSAFLTFMTSESLDFVSSTAFFEQLVGKASSFFLDHNPAEIQSAQHKGGDALNFVVQFSLAALLPGIAQVTLSIVMLGTVLDLDIALIVLVYGMVYIALVMHATRITRIHLDAAIEHSQESSKFIGNAIAGMDTLRQFGSDRWMIGQFTARQQSSLDSWRRYATTQVRFAGIFGLALTAQFALTLWLLVPRVVEGTLTVGDLVLFNTLLLQLNTPFQMVGQAIQQVSQSYSRFLPFARMWQAESHDDTTSGQPLTLTDGRVVFEDVTYRYPNGRGVEGASFAARRGTVTYITGDTGAGKSTLFKLLLKAMRPQQGRILIDGTDLTEISRADWFAHVAAVPQDVVLLNDTLATNIVLGRPHDEARLRRATERAAILDFIDGLDDGFQTVVGERGLKLSGGERQRIAIARALYADPAIVLLDEASSALDAETEKEIMDQLRRICDEVTIIAITHRLSVIRPEDTVIRIGPQVQ
ncbi:ABC transporter ATP-binding protein/permease [Pelagibacterium sp. 26DY04]|uniref:ABC transporter ATP-binding protein n=1 Tax=Pelagibacterium sp. 26DY04 TaxID=2967130 RepID=UPI0028159C1E|nr:ABC transporter ATP-binding protein [Pelagibacterium sp. 26DY04]WMT86026.1 ABC transporter ATP-binding protein/permease [Pelagibacterium sp. 26DY04]